ncbi:MAG: hypothetical protein JO019_04880 [Candidatus Kaiserbacteria bacterium]|nr:hypothetical protein [Candidatus Kaiserbacteria bacterium]
MPRFAYLSWVSLAASVALLGALIYGALSIQSSALDRANEIAQSAQESDKSAYNERLHSLAAETKDERAQLDTFAHMDIVTLVQMLEDVGKKTGTGAQVSDASAAGNGVALPGGENLQPVVFTLSAKGSFQQLMRAVSLYERLPLAVHIDDLDIEHDPDTDTAPATGWHMTARIRVTSVTQTSL